MFNYSSTYLSPSKLFMNNSISYLLAIVIFTSFSIHEVVGLNFIILGTILLLSLYENHTIKMITNSPAINGIYSSSISLDILCSCPLIFEWISPRPRCPHTVVQGFSNNVWQSAKRASAGPGNLSALILVTITTLCHRVSAISRDLVGTQNTSAVVRVLTRV